MPIILPAPPAHRLTPAEAGAVAKRGRKLLRAGKLTHRELALLDCLLWSCRNPVTGAIIVSYSALVRLARMARETVAGGLRRLEHLGVLTKIRRRVRLAWHQDGQTSRQATNAYLLHPPAPAHTEFAHRTVTQKLEIIYAPVQPNGVVEAAQAALARRRAAIEERLLGNRPAAAAGMGID